MPTSTEYLTDLMLDRSEEPSPRPYLILWTASAPMAAAMGEWDAAMELSDEPPEVLDFPDRSGVRYVFSEPEGLLAFVDRINQGGLPGSGELVFTGGQAAGLGDDGFARLASAIGLPQMFGIGDTRAW